MVIVTSAPKTRVNPFTTSSLEMAHRLTHLLSYYQVSCYRLCPRPDCRPVEAIRVHDTGC